MTLTSRGFLRFFIFFSVYLLFLILGASVFSAIEAPEEQEKVKNLRTLRSDFLKNHPCVPGMLPKATSTGDVLYTNESKKSLKSENIENETKHGTPKHSRKYKRHDIKQNDENYTTTKKLPFDPRFQQNTLEAELEDRFNSKCEENVTKLERKQNSSNTVFNASSIQTIIPNGAAEQGYIELNNSNSFFKKYQKGKDQLSTTGTVGSDPDIVNSQAGNNNVSGESIDTVILNTTAVAYTDPDASTNRKKFFNIRKNAKDIDLFSTTGTVGSDIDTAGFTKTNINNLSERNQPSPTAKRGILCEMVLQLLQMILWILMAYAIKYLLLIFEKWLYKEEPKPDIFTSFLTTIGNVFEKMWL